jgi:hypothetical protein
MHLFLKIVLIFRIFKARWIVKLNNTRGIVFDKNAIVKRPNKAFYILGCGSSINNLTKRQIRIINKSDSVGINLFIMHDEITPTYYSVEVTTDSKNHLKDSNSRILCDFLRKRASEDSGLKFIINIDGWKNVKKLIPDIHEYGQVNLIQQVTIPGKTSRYFTELNKFLCSKNVINLMKPEMVFGKNASLVSLIYMAMLRGYKDIVLCGVDLSSEYFWHGEYGNQRYPKGKCIINMHDKIKHNTDLTLFPVSELLRGINTSDSDVALWVASSESKLSNELPVYPFHD